MHAAMLCRECHLLVETNKHDVMFQLVSEIINERQK